MMEQDDTTHSDLDFTTTTTRSTSATTPPTTDEHNPQSHHLEPLQLRPAGMRVPSDPFGPTVAPLSSSVMDSEIGDEPHDDMVDEEEMTRHLMDIESSVAGGSSRIGTPWRPDELRRTASGTSRHFDDDSSMPLPSHITDHLQALHPITENRESSPQHEPTSALETMSSSPTAAAAARTVSRALSMASMGYDVGSTSPVGSPPQSSHTTPKNVLTPRIETNDDVEGDLSLNQTPDEGITNDAGRTPGVALLRKHSSDRRPKYLRSRQASQRSSVSSFLANPESVPDENDPTLEVEDAGPARPLLPHSGSANSFVLSRSLSLGSIVSGIDDYNGESQTSQKLATLDEEEKFKARDDDDEETRAPQTPRPNQALAPPTDTVIARHVHNVQVPDSVIKEYRNKNRVPEPERGISNSSLPFSRSSKNLTLKEQSSTIERLSKENFDLKLKVMFLSDRLDKLSEEGMKEMISENVDLKTGIAVLQRDNKALRKKLKELEKKFKDEEDRPSTAHSTLSADDQSPWFDQEGAQEREEELIYLRERIEEYEVELQRMRNDSLARENEKRKLAEALRMMGERRGEQHIDSREEMEVWKDLLEQETARREQSDEENRTLREELFRIRSEASGFGQTNTTNNYHINKRRVNGTLSRPQSAGSGQPDDRGGAMSSAATLVEELRRESEQLRHENAELRREVGAQTSMLTSRNREKERLYQEIEDLKLGQRRGTSIAGDSIFERSASRAFDRGRERERSRSRGSMHTKHTGMDDEERDELENKNAELRDQLNGLKMQNQEYKRELDVVQEELEITGEIKKDAEAAILELQEDRDSVLNDLQVMQVERDEALRELQEIEVEFEALRKEAQDEIYGLEAERDDIIADRDRIEADLIDRTENFEALQAEMRALSESVIKLEDAHEASLNRVRELEQEVQEQNNELEKYEKNLTEANTKLGRTTVQLESAQGEISFLREEQENDKVMIGDLQTKVKMLEQSLTEERDRTKELEQRIVAEREQRELVAGREKQEVQKFINDLNRQTSAAKDEASRLRRNLSSREVEATEWKERLMELENNLREALGDLNGTRSSLLKSIAKLQRELEENARDLDSAKSSLSEKDRLIKQRDALLESHGLEARKLAEMLEKERQAHRSTKHQHETFQKTHLHTTRTVAQQESRVTELQALHQQDRKKLVQLENAMKDQLLERNNLLLALWNRLSTLCGTDWAHNNRLINGRALPSLESVGTMLPGFSKNLLAAVKTLETLIGNFNQRIKSIEKDLTKKYSDLETQLEQRNKRLDKLEAVVKIDSAGKEDEKSEIIKLQNTIRLLRTELLSLRGMNNTPSRTPINRAEHSVSPSPSVPMGPRSSTLDLTRNPLSRTNTTALETLGGRSGSGISDMDETRWAFRLRELERRLKAEREARLRDRDGARKRLEEGEKRNTELRKELERNKIRQDTALH